MTIISLLQNSFLYREREKKKQKRKTQKYKFDFARFQYVIIVNKWLFLCIKKLKFLCKSETWYELNK